MNGQQDGSSIIMSLGVIKIKNEGSKLHTKTYRITVEPDALHGQEGKQFLFGFFISGNTLIC
jgi:hypothetical protein